MSQFYKTMIVSLDGKRWFGVKGDVDWDDDGDDWGSSSEGDYELGLGEVTGVVGPCNSAESVRNLMQSSFGNPGSFDCEYHEPDDVTAFIVDHYIKSETRRFGGGVIARPIKEGSLRAYYEEHKDEYRNYVDGIRTDSGPSIW